MTLTRREAVRDALLLAFTVGGLETWLTPYEARAAGADFHTLSAGEVQTLGAFGEALLPGAREAGIAHFVDQQLTVAPADSLLMIRYLDIPPPYQQFYQAGLAALDALSRSQHERGFAALAPHEAEELVGKVSRGETPGWQGPPAPLFFFVARSDAVDVVYGTEQGFQKLGIPYMPHIMPARKW